MQASRSGVAGQHKSDSNIQNKIKIKTFEMTLQQQKCQQQNMMGICLVSNSIQVSKYGERGTKLLHVFSFGKELITRKMAEIEKGFQIYNKKYS